MALVLLICLHAAVLAQPAGAPVRVQVLTMSDSSVLVTAAEELMASLAHDVQVVTADRVAIPTPISRASDWREAERAVTGAQQAYMELDANGALMQVGRAEKLLLDGLDDAAAVLLLARALRVKALTELYLGLTAEAGRSFVSAWLLDPEFSPAAAEWPPEARLAYADTIAADRHKGAGALSLDVTPAAARVWLDGKPLGLGSTSARDLHPGDHYLFATCPGHTSFAAVVSVTPGGKLTQASIHLEPRPGGKLDADAAAALVAAWRTSDEALVARQVARLLQPAILALVALDESAPEGAAPVAWLLTAKGGRLGGAVALGSPASAAAAIVGRALGKSASDPLTLSRPWYGRWYTWVAAGVLVVGGGVALGFALAPNPERVSFGVGYPK